MLRGIHLIKMWMPRLFHFILTLFFLPLPLFSVLQLRSVLVIIVTFRVRSLRSIFVMWQKRILHVGLRSRSGVQWNSSKQGSLVLLGGFFWGTKWDGTCWIHCVVQHVFGNAMAGVNFKWSFIQSVDFSVHQIFLVNWILNLFFKLW